MWLGMLAAAMKARMESFFPSDKNIVIILAGTNDLLRRASGAAIGADVIELHETAKRLMRDGGTNRPYTVAITIPSTHTPSQETERLAANRIIRRYVSESSGSTLLLDMEDMWPVSSAADIERFNIFWSPDMTHFSVQGYERMGYELYEIIKYHLLSSSNPQ